MACGSIRFAEVVAVVSSGLVTCGVWSVFGYAAIVLPQLTHPNDNSHLNARYGPNASHGSNASLGPKASLSLNTSLDPNASLYLSPSQASWFASLPLFMCIPGSIVGGTLCEKIGPRRIQLLLAPLLALFFVASYLPSWPGIQEASDANIILMVIRVFQGSIAALLIPTGSVYPCEVSKASHRGSLGSLVEAWITLGFLLCYLLGRYLYWYTTAWLLPLFTIVPGFFCLLLSPESPLWLARKGRETEAKVALLRLRNSPDEVEQEITQLKVCVLKKSNLIFNSMHLIKKKSNLKPVIISILVLVIKEFSGISVITIYIVRIFEFAGVGHDPFWNSFIVGSVRLMCNLIASVLLYHIPCKFLLVGGNLLNTVGMALIGVFFYLQDQGNDLLWLSWLPLVGLIVFMVGISSAVMPASWLVAMEILPGPIRSLGFGISITCYAITSFLMTITFDDVKEVMGLYGLFWCYSLGCIVHCLFVAIFVPETHGRSLRDIEMSWEHSSMKNKKTKR